MVAMGEKLPGAASIERVMAWELLGTGKVRGLWPIAEGQAPDAFVELHLDARRRIIGVREWLEGEAQPVERRFTLDSGGRLLRSQRRGPHPSIELENTYRYDAKGMLAERQEQSVATGQVRFRTTSKVDRRGYIVENAMHDGGGVLKERVTYERDDAGRPTREQKFRGPAGVELIGTFVYTYDAKGHEVKRVWHGPDGADRAVTEIAYDEHDRPVSVTLTVPGKGGRTLLTTYDPRGKKIGTDLRNADGAKVSEIRPSAVGITWRRTFVPPPPASGDGSAGRFAPVAGGINEAARQGLIALAWEHYQNRRYAEALPVWEKLARETPDDIYVVSAVAACNLELERWELAKAWYEKALALDPDHAQSRLGYDVVKKAMRLA